MPKNLTTLSKDDVSEFKSQLTEYKTAIDSNLHSMQRELEVSILREFGSAPHEVVTAYSSILLNGGKRIRGAIAISAYNLFGGQNEDLIMRGACALEMLNTYILIADDIQDRSHTRRGTKTAHVALRDYHMKHHLKGDAQHFGEALAINSLLVAQHYASNLIAFLPTDPATVVRALQNINKCFIVTSHGQTMDLFVEATGSASLEDVNNILEWKTAYYTFINPLQLGAILAGADTHAIEALAEYGLYAGKAFQLTDDIIGTFGDESKTGKSALDDIKEGKRTFMVVKALQHASSSDAYFLESCLGNQQLTMHEFKRCKKIIQDTGALASTRQEATTAVEHALQALENSANNWQPEAKKFLMTLARYVLVRDA